MTRDSERYIKEGSGNRHLCIEAGRGVCTGDFERQV
jgi:hypothetical protein